MLGTARMMILVYAVILFAGGLAGYLVKHSKMSLLTSGLSALVLVGGFVLADKQPKAGFALSAAVAVSLAGFFGYRFIKTHSVMPPGAICALSILAAIGFLLAWKQSR